MRTRISSNYRDGYFVREDENGRPRMWWINDNAGAGAGSAPPSRPYGGVRHYLADTGFDALKGLDQNPAEFERVATSWLGVSWSDVAPSGGAMTVTPPPAMGGGSILGSSPKELIEALTDFYPALTAPPIPPKVVPGDMQTNFANTFTYLQALELHFRRDEVIKVLGDGIGLAMTNAGLSQIKLSDLIRVGGKAYVAVVTPPVAPKVVAGSATGDENFANLFTFIDANAKFAKSDELVRAVANFAGNILRGQGK